MNAPQPHKNITQFIEALMTKKARNGWVSGGGLKLYARRGYHSIEGKIKACIDIASVEADHPGNGAFTTLVDWLENEFLPKEGGIVFVESILNPRLASFLSRRGYFQQNHGLGASNMYKVVAKRKSK